MTLSRLTRRLFMCVASFLAIALGVAGWFVLVHPNAQIVETRTSSAPESILVEYVNDTCDPYAPRLYEVVAGSGIQAQLAERPLSLALPVDLASPEDSQLAYSGNRFILVAYRYRRTLRGFLVGTRSEEPSPRVDLVAWKVVAPYRVWSTEVPGESQTRQETVQQTTSVEHSASHFVLQKYNDCF